MSNSFPPLQTTSSMSLSYPRRQRQLQSLVQKLGLPAQAPVQWHLLDLALTHSTVSAQANYEQLEFIGDAVVRLLASEVLWKTYPEWAVGEFAAVRSVLVSDRVLANLATEYGLELYLLVAGSAVTNWVGQLRLADAFEAVIGALYLSTHNLELITPWLGPHFQQLAAEVYQDPARLNYKAALQEWTQAQFKVLPEYRVIQIEQDGDELNRFYAEVWLQEKKLGQGTGRSIKAAEQAAAQVAFLEIRQ